MNYIKKNLSNILFFGFIIFLFTPYGLPVRALLIKGVSFVTTRVFNMEIDENERESLSTYDWKLIDLNGNSVNLTDYKDKVLFVNYWATWCPPCIAEMPSLQSLYDDYKDKVTFLFVASDEEERVEKFILDKKHTIPVYFQGSQNPPEMQSNSLPTTYIINKNGEIVVNKTGAADWDSKKIRNLLDKLIQ